MFFLMCWALYRVSACLSSVGPGLAMPSAPCRAPQAPVLLLLVIICTVLGVGRDGMVNVARADAVSPFGPLRLVNQHPLQLLFLQPSPDLATPVAARHAVLQVNIALTNTLVQNAQPDFSAKVDLEMVRAVADLRYGVFARLEVGLELPFLYTHGGILDEFIESFEGTFGYLIARRKDQDAREVAYRVLRNNRLSIALHNDAAGIGDAVAKAKFQLLREGLWQPVLSVRGALKFPTGSTTQAFGSGAVDGGLGLLVQKSFGRWTFYLNGDLTLPGDAFAELDVQPFVGGLVAVEFRLSQALSLVGQFRGDSRPFHATIPLLDRRLFGAQFGLNWAITPAVVLQGGLGEDAAGSGCCASDVSFFLNLAAYL